MNNPQDLSPAASGPEPVFFLPGWGFDTKILTLGKTCQSWQTLPGGIPPHDTIEALVSHLESALADRRITLIGWSMGAYLAIDFARTCPEKLSAIYLLSARSRWPEPDIQAIRQGLGQGAREFMTTFYRTCFLGGRSLHQRFKDTLEEDYLAHLDEGLLEAGLDYLAAYPTEERAEELAKLPVPVIQVQGSRDLIAPADEALEIPGAISKRFDNCGHMTFLDQRFQPNIHTRKAAVCRRFSRAARSYGDYAVIQTEAAARLADLLPQSTSSVLECGCGTGGYTRLIRAKLPETAITALDFSEEMLGMARVGLSPRTELICADAESYLNENPKTFELITANAALQWFDDLPRFFRSAAANLAPGGTLLFSIFGPESLKELQEGIKTIFDIVLPAASFPSREDLERDLADFPGSVEIEEWLSRKEYRSTHQLLRQIRRTGTSGWHESPPVFTRGRLAELDRWFRLNHQGCRVSYQIFFIRAQKTRQPGTANEAAC